MISTIVSTIILTIASGMAGGGRAVAADAPLWTTIAPPRRRTTPLADLAERAMPAVVHIRGLLPPLSAPASGGNSSDGESDGDAEGDRISIGTGFIVEAGGYIVTNDHVVRNVSQLRVRFFDGREVPACVLGSDAPSDIALLKVDVRYPLPVLPLGDSDRVRVGEPVVAIGNPFGFNSSVTAGIVSAKERVVDSPAANQGSEAEAYSFFIQTDASINLGNSGGPLIDQSGQVVGVSAAFWAGHSMQPAQGIGFAIPINMAKALLPRLRDQGSAPRSSLGVDAQPVDSALAAALGLPSTRGALLASVDRGSAAELAGIEPGDVIIGWGNVGIATREALKIDAQLTVPGTRVMVTLLRNGNRLVRQVTLRAAPTKMAALPHPSGCASPRGDETSIARELALVEVSGDKAARLPSGRGVAIAEVPLDSPAAEAGMRVGDVVLRIGRAQIRSGVDVAAAIKSFRGAFIPVLLRRSGYDFWVALPRQ
jgi:serine protease Do